MLSTKNLQVHFYTGLSYFYQRTYSYLAAQMAADDKMSYYPDFLEASTHTDVYRLIFMELDV